MADHEPVDLSRGIENLLRQELAIEPSPEFLARVRERSASEGSAPWFFGWKVGFAGAAAALVAALAIQGTPRPVTEHPAPASEHSAPLSTHPAPAPEHPALLSKHPAPASAHRAPASEHPAPLSKHQAPASKHPAPKEVVLVDPRHRAALTELFRMVDEHRVSEENFATRASVVSPPTELRPLAVEPLALSVIAVGGVLQNEIERN